MKRIFSWVLLAVMMLSLFAGCSNNTAADPTNAPVAAPTEEVVVADENLANAIAYLKAFYKTVRDGDLTPSDFERLGTVRVGLTAYEVVYTVDCDESAVKIVKGENGMVTIDVNEDSEVEVPYALTATITGTDGQTASLVWNHVLPISMNGRGAEIVDAAYALEDGEALPYEATLTGEIISVDTPYSADYKNITVSIKVEGREDKPIQCYRLKGEGADTLMPGDIITVTGTLKNYKGTIEFDAGCVLEKVTKGENSMEILTDPQEILKAAYELDYGKSLPYPVTLSGRVVGYDTKYSPQYGNVTVTIKTGDPWYYIKCYRMKGEGVDQVFLDDVITVTGYLKNYNGTIEFDAGCIMDSWTDNPDPVGPTDPAEIIDEAYETLRHGQTLPYACTLTGTVTSINTPWSDQFGNITVTMVVAGSEDQPIKCYRMEGGENAKNLMKGDVITVYGWLMNYEGEIEFMRGCDLIDVVSKVPAQVKPATLKEQLEDAVKYGTNTYESRVKGPIVGTPAYDSKYDSWNFNVQDEESGLMVYCYSLAKGKTLYKGDIVEVVGRLTSHYESPQFSYNPGATVTVISSAGPGTGELTGLAKDLEDASKLANGEYLDRTTSVSGTVVSVKKYSSYEDGKKAWDFNIAAEGEIVQCYFVNFGKEVEVEVGNKISITGKLSAHNGTPQFNKTATITSHNCKDAVEEEPEEPGNEVTADSPLADQLAAAGKLGSGATLPFTTTVTGTIVSDPVKSTRTEGAYRFNISVDGNTITCYYVPVSGGVPKNGDTVTVSGKLSGFSGSGQFAEGNASATLHGGSSEEECKHDVVEDEVILPPTCGTTGLKNVVCDACGEIVEENVEISATGAHSFENGGETCDNCSEPNPNYVAPENSEGGEENT